MKITQIAAFFAVRNESSIVKLQRYHKWQRAACAWTDKRNEFHTTDRCQIFCPTPSIATKYNIAITAHLQSPIRNDVHKSDAGRE